jgi:hypothetical protein
VNPRWPWLCLLAFVACAREAEPPRDPETVPPSRTTDSTGTSPDESAPMHWTAHLDSAEITTGWLALSGDSLSGTGGQSPRVVVRCETGRLGAYVVMAGAPDSDWLDERAVRVTMDSAPRC